MKIISLLGTLIITIITGTYLAFLRYDNQNLRLSNFNLFIPGNLISAVFLALILLFIIINLFSGNKPKPSTLIAYLIISITGLFSLVVANNLSNKEAKIILSIFFFVCYEFILISIASTAFSRSKKLHLFNDIVKTVLLTLFVVLLVFLRVYFYADDSDAYEQKNKKADAGVILGAAVWGGNRPSPVLRERINKGYEVYEKKYVQKLVLTGGGSPREKTEAEVSKKTLLGYGVDYKDIITEEFSNSTVEQINFIRDSLYSRQNWKKIILISDNYHLFRAKQICIFNRIDADCISSDTPLSTEGGVTYCIKESFTVIVFWLFGIG